MKYKIIKPENREILPYWVEGMDCLNGHIIDEKQISIRHGIGYDYFPIIADDCLWNINTEWIIPVSEEKQLLLGL